jgi:hypothetical protein
VLGEDYRLEHIRTDLAFAAWADVATEAALISIDHHMEAARALARHPPLALVVLHGSDPAVTRAQEGVLSAAGWESERLPFDTQSWAATLVQVERATAPD